MKRSMLLATTAMLALSTALAAAQSSSTQPNTSDRKQVEETSPPSPSPQQNPQMQRSQGGSTQNQQQPSAPQSTQNQQNQPAPTQRSTQGQQPQPATSQTQNQPAQGHQQQGNQQRQTQSPAATQQGAQQPSTSQAAQPSGQQPSGQAAATTPQQRTQIATTIQQQNVSPVRVNFAVNVGVAVPTSVRLAPLPDTIVSIVPQYRGYNYFVTEQQIVIVEPASHRIVEVLPMEGRGRAAAAPARKLEFTKEQREAIKKHATSKQRTTTTGSARRVTVEETIPADVELEEFSDVVVKEVPTVRSYRYIRRDNDVIVVDPGSRRVLDVID